MPDKANNITISKMLVAEENEFEYKTRVPFTYGDDVRYLNLKKDDVEEINNGKTLLTTLSADKNYMLYDKNDKVVANVTGTELFSLHYDEVPKNMAEKSKKVQTENINKEVTAQQKTQEEIMQICSIEDNAENRETLKQMTDLGYTLCYSEGFSEDGFIFFEDTNGNMLPGFPDFNEVKEFAFNEDVRNQDKLMTENSSLAYFSFDKTNENLEVIDKMKSLGWNLDSEICNSDDGNKSILYFKNNNEEKSFSGIDEVKSFVTQFESIEEKENLKPLMQSNNNSPKLQVLANIYDNAKEKIAKQQDKIEVLSTKNGKATNKIEKAQQFVELCNSVKSTNALPTPFSKLAEMMSESKQNKIKKLEAKISKRNIKISKAEKKIEKAEKTISTVSRIDNFIANLSSAEGRKENLVNGIVDFSNLARNKSENRLETVTSKLDELQTAKDKTHFQSEKLNLSKQIEKLSAKKEKLENKISSCIALSEKITDIKALNDIQTEKLCNDITANVVVNATTTPDKVSAYTVVNACNKSITDIPLNERVSQNIKKEENISANDKNANMSQSEQNQSKKTSFGISISDLKKSAKIISNKQPDKQMQNEKENIK